MKVMSPATVEAYASDQRAYERWGGIFPATPQMVCDWITEQANRGLTAATIQRRLSSLSTIHQTQGLIDPVRDPIVRQTHTAIRRRIGVRKKKKMPILRDDLRSILETMNPRDTRDLRGMTLLAWGFVGPFRRSELAALRFSDLQPTDGGYNIRIRGNTHREIRRSAERRYCPVKLMQNWLKKADIKNGPVFRQISTGGNVSPSGISGSTVNRIFKGGVERIGKDPTLYGGLSPWKGHVIEARLAGEDPAQIAYQLGHTSWASVIDILGEADLIGPKHRYQLVI